MPSVVLILLVLLGSCALAGTPFGLRNGDLREQKDGKLVGWEQIGDCRVIPDGGRKGMPAVELICSGEGTSAARQVLRFDLPRRGAFAVKAWMRCDEVEPVGDCCLWLDVCQAGGPPMWGQQGLPRIGYRRWQQVSVEVRPTHPVTEVHVYLMLRSTRGKVRFCDVRMEQLPLEIRELRLHPASASSYDVWAEFSGEADWRISAKQKGREIWTLSGTGIRIAERFTASGTVAVTVIVAAELNGVTKTASARVKPPRRAPVFDWWIADSSTRVFQDDLPPIRPVTRVGLNAARNDRESFQICLRPTGEVIKKVQVSASDLVMDSPQCAKSATCIPKSEIEWFRVGYVWVEQPFAHPYSPRRTSSWWPDPLLPPGDFCIESGQVQPLWFTIHVPERTAPGTYRGSITIRADGAPGVEVPVSVTVHPAVIPVQGYMKTAFALMDGFLEKVYGKATRPLRRAYTDYLLAHRLSPDDVSRTRLPDLAELEYADSRGLNAFNILNVVSEPTKRVTWVCYDPVSAYTPEFKERFFRRLDAFIPELEKRGLLDKAYIYGFDERGSEYIPIIQDLFGEIKRRYPRVHTLSTAWLPPGTDPLSLNIDWYVPMTSSYDHELAESVRRRGGEVWWYICMGPNYPYANWLLENPLIEARLIWWQAFQYDVEGFLYWGVNIWDKQNNDEPIPSTAGPRIDWSVTAGGQYPSLNGDGELLYPGEKGPIGSIRLENFRDGLEDIELLRQHEKRFGRKPTLAILRRVALDRTDYSRDSRNLLASRLKLLRALK
ncbi:MAG TPA: glycoside hydrolase domain-containing protein [Armatimonadota bacterium]|nr:glycoside hydrolase domain-containing protein [Armatimonadota bacterium]